MLELPEAHTIAGQLRESVTGHRIVRVVANASPHKFAFFAGDPAAYPGVLTGLALTDARSYGGLVELVAEEVSLVFGDGANLRLLGPGVPLPAKHQLAVTLDDDSTLVCSVQMYGGLWLGEAGDLDSPYFRVARRLPSPLSPGFDDAHIAGLLAGGRPTLSAKALLATEQRIPGVGNGVLQDVLFNARVHPRSQVGALAADDLGRLFASLRTTLAEMAGQGGRDTERDLYGMPGGYRTLLCARALELPCPGCGGAVERQAFLGGKVYLCPACQPHRTLT